MRSFNQRLEDVYTYKARPGQKLGDYCFRKLEKLRKLEYAISDEDQIDAVIGGISDTGIARAIQSAKIKDVDELYSFMRRMGDVPTQNGRRRTTPEPSRRKQPSSSTASTSRRQEQGVQARQKGTAEKGLSQVRCFNCGTIGHYSRDCTKPRVQKEVKVIQASRYVPHLYELSIHVNGRKIDHSLVDTGSACTVIHSSLARGIGLVIKTTEGALLRGFAGQTVSIDKIARVTIKIQGVIADVNSYIVPDECTAYRVIVGRDFLLQEHVVMVKRGQRLTFNEIPSIEYTTIEPDRNMYVCDIQSNIKLQFGDTDEKTREACTALIDEFRDCTSSSMRDLGKTNTAAIEIKCLSDTPVAYRPYRLGEPEKKVVREIVAELIENGIVRESDSPYASPITLVKKATGEDRLCIDFRKMNAITIKDKYPLPLIDDQIDRLGGNKYFTGLDLASGYYQVPVATNSIPKNSVHHTRRPLRVSTNAVWSNQRTSRVPTTDGQGFRTPQKHNRVPVLGRRDSTVANNRRGYDQVAPSIGSLPRAWIDVETIEMFLFQNVHRVPRAGN